jgi:hypothetical protein
MPFLGKKPTEIASPVDINSGSIDGTTIGGGSASPATVTTFTSTGIDDNATSTAITIDSSENVGIGVTDVKGRLSVIGPDSEYQEYLNVGHSTSSARLHFTPWSTLAQDRVYLAHNIYRSSSGGFENDKTGIGMSYVGFLDSGSIAFGTEATAASAAPTERMRLDSSGNLLVGRTSLLSGGGHTLQSSSSSQVYRASTGSSNSILDFYSDVGGTETINCRIFNDGDIQNTNNSYGSLSDERLKSNIVNASSQLDDIMAVQVRSYTLNSTGETHIGVVAQELEASGMSGLVKTDDEGMKSVKYSILYMKAIKAIQEQQTIIDSQASAIADLTARLEALEAN